MEAAGKALDGQVGGGEAKVEVTLYPDFFDAAEQHPLSDFDVLLAFAPEVAGLTAATQASSEYFEGSAARDPATVAYYTSALDAIPNCDDREVWFPVGAALYELGWGDVGYDMWATWSKRSDKFDEALQLSTWAGFPKYRETHLDNLVTPGTLIHMATEAGWEAPTPPPEVVKAKEAIVEAKWLS
jgi:hypothetical protein